jgi:signal transduction histidine kinase
MFWPAWRLYDLFMLALAYYTWRYAWRANDLKVIYTELGKGTKLKEELAATKEESKRKSFFLNAISHDLRTPLNGLMLQASLADISADSGDVEGVRHAVRDMKASARATGELLDTLLEYARLDWTTDPNNITTFRLHDAVDAATVPHRPAAREKGIWLRNNCPPDLVLTADRQKLERVLGNLVGNAVKFTADGGVRVEVAHAGAAAEVHVIDTGVGIDPAGHDRLFEEFFQVQNNERDRRKGFGLGLSIARRLARQLGGDVTVESAVGRGSRFTVALPNVVGPQPAAGRQHDQPAAEAKPDQIPVTAR